jgi:hypothetical protein
MRTALPSQEGGYLSKPVKPLKRPTMRSNYASEQSDAELLAPAPLALQVGPNQTGTLTRGRAHGNTEAPGLFGVSLVVALQGWSGRLVPAA